MTQRFKYYMHDNCDTMERIHNIESQGVTLTPAQKDNLVMKNTSGQSEFIGWCHKVAQYNVDTEPIPS